MLRAETKVLREHSVDIADSVAAHIRQHRAHIAEGKWRRAGKHARVEPARNGRVGYRRTLPVVHGRPPDGHGLATLHAHDAAQIPIAEDGVLDAVPALADATIPAHRH